MACFWEARKLASSQVQLGGPNSSRLQVGYPSPAPVSEPSPPPEFVLFLALDELAEGGEGGGDVVAEPGGGGALRLAAEDAEVAVGVADADG